MAFVALVLFNVTGGRKVHRKWKTSGWGKEPAGVRRGLEALRKKYDYFRI
jgi:hypothetical protein